MTVEYLDSQTDFRMECPVGYVQSMQSYSCGKHVSSLDYCSFAFNINTDKGDSFIFVLIIVLFVFIYNISLMWFLIIYKISECNEKSAW